MKTLKKVRNSKGFRFMKTIAGAGASIGASALATYAINKYGGKETFKGLKALCAGAGIFGLASWASNEAQKAIQEEFDSWIDAVDAIADTIVEIADAANEESSDSDDDFEPED